jgi:hypothetical protein
MSAWADEVEDDLKWREAELAALKKICLGTEPRSDARNAMLRALSALLYAHYEGFYKFCWDYLFDFIEKESLRKSAVNRSFFLLSSSKSVKDFCAEKNYNFIFDVASFMRKLMSEDVVFPARLETKSNLWPNVAKDNNKKIGFNCSGLDEHCTKLKLIVSRRNDIAHGKKLVIKDVSDYQPYEDVALSVMHEVGLCLIDCIEGRSYRINKVSRNSRSLSPIFRRRGKRGRGKRKQV